MLMRRWSPPSQLPTTSLDYNVTKQNQRICLHWYEIIVFTFILITLISFGIIYILQKERLFKQENEYKQQEEFNQKQQLLFDTYIQDISNILLQISDKNSTNEKFLHIRTKTLLILRYLDIKRKKDIILFLYERNLIQNNQLNLYGADLNNIELTCPHDFHYLHLSGVFLSNAIFINCHLKSAVFNQTYLINARFINSTIQYASFIETNLDHSHFIQTIIMNTNFNGASLIQANFLQADIVQGNNFQNADLYQAKLTNNQLEGKHHFYHARFPNGSFGLLNSKENLIFNGNAEIECFTNNQTAWKTIDHHMILLTQTIENLTINDNQWGDCSFVILNKTRVYQNISLSSYSLLIDTNNAVFSFLAYANCNGSYFEINMYHSNDILLGSKIYLKSMEEINSNDNKSMYLYGENQYHLPIHTRRIEIYFGIDIFQTDIECYFDNITFTIDQKTK